MEKSDAQSSGVVKIAVVGAGLAGTMLAALLEKLERQHPSLHVVLFEKRALTEQEGGSDAASSAFGNSTSAAKRSINLALSYRGIQALKELGLLEEVLETAINMPKRVIHQHDGQIVTQKYGIGDETLYSVSRQGLNKTLLQYITTNSKKIEVRKNHSLIFAKEDGDCCFTGADGKEYSEHFSLVIGSDGAYSKVRESMLRQGRISFSRSYILHGYKELSIPPTFAGDFALDESEGLHIWPKKEFMLIALPNHDRSFTATLFATYESCFDELENDPKKISAFFETHFPSALKHMPHVVEDYIANPVGPLLTVRTRPWYVGRLMVIGDAAHAVVPFYGQGMNAAFEDALLLYQHLQAIDISRVAGGAINELSLLEAVKKFAESRQPAADALADLCLDHYYDMADNTTSWLYLTSRKVQTVLEEWFPTSMMSLYRMIAFSNVPYDEAMRRAQLREVRIRNIVITSSLVGLAAGVIGWRVFGGSHRLTWKI